MLDGWFSGKRLLAVVAHHDDEVLGCGGTLARVSDAGAEVTVLICARKRLGNDVSATLQAHYDGMAQCALDVLTSGTGILVAPGEIPGDRFPGHQWQLMKMVEREAEAVHPDIVLTHGSLDSNQDHRAVYDACRVAFRRWLGTIAMWHFEIPSSTPPGFVPDVFVPLGFSHVERKLGAWDVYKDEHREGSHPRSVRALSSLMAWRGSQIGIEYAEAFSMGHLIV